MSFHYRIYHQLRAHCQSTRTYYFPILTDHLLVETSIINQCKTPINSRFNNIVIALKHHVSIKNVYSGVGFKFWGSLCKRRKEICVSVSNFIIFLGFVLFWFRVFFGEGGGAMNKLTLSENKIFVKESVWTKIWNKTVKLIFVWNITLHNSFNHRQLKFREFSSVINSHTWVLDKLSGHSSTILTWNVGVTCN